MNVISKPWIAIGQQKRGEVSFNTMCEVVFGMFDGTDDSRSEIINLASIQKYVWYRTENSQKEKSNKI